MSSRNVHAELDLVVAGRFDVPDTEKMRVPVER
jgi:hypothetical protein